MSSPVIAALHRYTHAESPTGDLRALAELAAMLEADATAAGFATAREPHPTGDHLLWTLPARGGATGSMLFLTHYDTVWPVGTLRHMPWTVDGDTIRGPGVYDTKSGIAALLAAAALSAAPADPTATTADPGNQAGVVALDGARPEIRVIVVADEEIGSPTATALVTAEAQRADAVLGLEPPHPGGDLKTGRRGSTRARIEVTGVEAHAALDPDAGANAIDELVDQLIRVRELRRDRPVLINTGTIAGGGRTNVVAGQAHADLGLRFADPDDERAVLAELTALQPIHPRAGVATRLLSHRPTWQPSPSGAELLTRIVAVAAGIGQRLDGRPADGAADTNTTGALGRPTIDGLAPRGGGAHARTEWVSATGITERITLLTALLTRTP
ncbi:M20/M25/M40 family metallo-hydrolase [Actinoplanes sp. NPDC020271]|uniref:M20/M25/M40 family metallo-hydrolase n=1 Tax=Actinoplanes sp. NPDC020271 TaxID=3363896 RepID=UPI0037AA6AAB